MTKRTSGESHLIGKKAEETLTVTKKKKSPVEDEECDFCFLNYYSDKSMEKKCDRVSYRKCNVWYHKVCFGAKGTR